MQAWGAFLAAHAGLVRAMDQTLRERAGMSLQWYDALAQIAGGGGRVTMRELERRVLLSQSGLSRLVDRLQQAGLVTRTAAPSDRRSVEVSLTPRGRTRLRRAREVQSEQVRTRFADRMSQVEAETVLRVLCRIGHEAAEEAQRAEPSG
jgi:DNA-binding MarR family transcriptional regulator